jgi:hypothetical protein
MTAAINGARPGLENKPPQDRPGTRTALGMIYFYAALGHHLLEIPVAERIAEIPAPVQHNQLALEASSTKYLRPVLAHSSLR